MASTTSVGGDTSSTAFVFCVLLPFLSIIPRLPLEWILVRLSRDDDHEEETKEEPRGPAFFLLMVLRDILTILCATFEQPAVAVGADKTMCVCVRDKK